MELDKRIKRLIRADIDRIEITASSHGYSARAVPNSFHPLVAARRSEAYAAAGRNLSLSEATEINNSSMGPVARGHDEKSLEVALEKLAAEMKKLGLQVA